MLTLLVRPKVSLQPETIREAPTSESETALRAAGDHPEHPAFNALIKRANGASSKLYTPFGNGITLNCARHVTEHTKPMRSLTSEVVRTWQPLPKIEEN